MLIDWFTVAAQALNFLILVWLLKRFLYKPILNALDAREKRIAAELADADAKKAEARQERDEFQRKNEEIDQQRAALLTKSEEDATVERQRLLNEARKESDDLRTKWQEALRSEHQSLSEELTRRTREEVFAIARKTLADLATTNLEEQMTDAFIRRLHKLDSAERGELESAFKAASTPAIVRSTFDLPSAQRSAIEGVVKDVLAIETHVQFETAPDLVSGIELSANGHKVAWSIGNYLASLQKHVDDLLNVPPKAATKAIAPPEQQANG
ncbi:MAG: F0F1 ATP synthase subunit B [Nitrospirales bacterium]|nr:F0F1 ATP synthase subunit B [Nitrospirales bacterium]